MGQFVPIAPANCCKMCLSETVRPIDECADLNMCSGHGMCVTGSCECSPGWGGADCGVQVRQRLDWPAHDVMSGVLEVQASLCLCV